MKMKMMARVMMLLMMAISKPFKFSMSCIEILKEPARSALETCASEASAMFLVYIYIYIYGKPPHHDLPLGFF